MRYNQPTMNIALHRQPFYIQIHSNRLLGIWGSISLGKTKAWAGAFFPFIITTDRIEPDRKPIIINHELIHFAQQKETLLIGSWLLFILETTYYRLVKKLPANQAYIAKSTEQEAYANMFNPNYLQTRPHYAHLKHYLHHKPITWENKWNQAPATKSGEAQLPLVARQEI